MDEGWVLFISPRGIHHADSITCRMECQILKYEIQIPITRGEEVTTFVYPPIH